MSGLSTALAAFLLLCSVAIEAQTLPAAGRTAPSPAPQNLVEIDASQPVTALETGFLHLGGKSATGHDLEINSRYPHRSTDRSGSRIGHHRSTGR